MKVKTTRYSFKGFDGFEVGVVSNEVPFACVSYSVDNERASGCVSVLGPEDLLR